MKLDIYKALWGMEGPLESQLQRIAAAGYDGIESPCGWIKDHAEFRQLLQRHQLKFIPVFFTEGGLDVAAHIASFEKQLARVTDVYSPEKITVHSGRDSWSFDQQCRFYEAAMSAEARHSVAVGHETHRLRAMFTPWTTAALLKAFPTLKLCCDFSHWVCVCERLLDDQEENLALAIERAIHIHGRVGYEEGPQVPHPAAPEWQVHLERHESWWERIMAAQKRRAAATATFTPEFGPPGYLHTLPFTKAPVADLWEVCLWMANRARQRLGPVVEERAPQAA